MACDKEHTGGIPKTAIEGLQDSQKGFWRHKCAGCAYEMGKRDAGESETRLRERVRELSDKVDDLSRQLAKKK